MYVDLNNFLQIQDTNFEPNLRLFTPVQDDFECYIYM